MPPVPMLTRKECEFCANMSWTRLGFLFSRWRLECLCGRAGPWRKEPEYQKPGPPPFGGSGARMILLPEPPPFEKAERALWGQKWTAGEADKLRSEEHTSELQSLMRISYAVFCLKKKKKPIPHNKITHHQHILIHTHDTTQLRDSR